MKTVPSPPIIRIMLVVVYILVGLCWWMIVENRHLIIKNESNTIMRFDTARQQHGMIINDLDTVKNILRNGTH